ncbi:hypothetical protein UFOVP1138_38 [uncultured Caudovirales phage]|uniref:Uncharacterized protein n=1 Tax=uncultured Caudovirales phage TaxID=2100421 RepID=A0A6J5S7G1_9CAUD|nr:hypothetical protein UFOVP975_83 [uncultured Caudovirales phage]CAB4186245.1 hypothetical protein UFOVP1138_38 [uncultured Caudovirales phage]CAB4204415.1 hypothetical protein UFOVP1394_35 [uncultured Caudovirales phage]
MTLKEIRDEAWAIARVSSSEPDESKLWNKSEMNRYINRVYRKIARETRCIRDAFTSSVCRIDISPPASLAVLQALAVNDVFAADDLAGYNDVDSWLSGKLVAPRLFPLHPTILDIDEIKWKNWPWRLTVVSVTKWQNNPFWERIVGSPTECATDYQNGYLTLNYRTTASDTLLMKVRRLPLTDLINDTDAPEFRTNYHDLMVNGVLAQMYAKQDAETIDLKKASDYEIAYRNDIDDIKQQETIFDQRLKVNFSMSAFR